MNLSVPMLLTGLLFAPALLAASNTQLAVNGAITPNACQLNLTGGGDIDHGKVSAQTLNADQYTSLPTVVIDMEVVCEGSTLLAFNTVDNSSGSSAINDNWHGLGMVNDEEKLGSVYLGIINSQADDMPAGAILSRDGGATWMPTTYLGHNGMTAIALTSQPLVPAALTTLKAQLRFNTMIARANDLTLTDEVPLDGHITVQMKYL